MTEGRDVALVASARRVAVDAHRGQVDTTGADCVTHPERVAADPLAVVVELADVDDNTDPARVALLDAATRQRSADEHARAHRVLADLAGGWVLLV